MSTRKPDPPPLEAVADRLGDALPGRWSYSRSRRRPPYVWSVEAGPVVASVEASAANVDDSPGWRLRAVADSVDEFEGVDPLHIRTDPELVADESAEVIGAAVRLAAELRPQITSYLRRMETAARDLAGDLSAGEATTTVPVDVIRHALPGEWSVEPKQQTDGVGCEFGFGQMLATIDVDRKPHRDDLRWKVRTAVGGGSTSVAVYHGVENAPDALRCTARRAWRRVLLDAAAHGGFGALSDERCGRFAEWLADAMRPLADQATDLARRAGDGSTYRIGRIQSAGDEGVQEWLNL